MTGYPITCKPLSKDDVLPLVRKTSIPKNCIVGEIDPVHLLTEMYFKGPRGEIQNHSDLVLLSLHLQLQLHSAHCLSLTQQQPLGELETPHHLLKTNTLTLTLTRVNCVPFPSRWSGVYLLLLSCRYVLLHQSLVDFGFLSADTRKRGPKQSWIPRGCEETLQIFIYCVESLLQLLETQLSVRGAAALVFDGG